MKRIILLLVVGVSDLLILGFKYIFDHLLILYESPRLTGYIGFKLALLLFANVAGYLLVRRSIERTTSHLNLRILLKLFTILVFAKWLVLFNLVMSPREIAACFESYSGSMRICSSVEKYYEHRKHLPKTLFELELPRASLYDPWGFLFKYSKESEASFYLEPIGFPDGLPGGCEKYRRASKIEASLTDKKAGQLNTSCSGKDHSTTR